MKGVNRYKEAFKKNALVICIWPGATLASSEARPGRHSERMGAMAGEGIEALNVMPPEQGPVGCHPRENPTVEIDSLID